MDVPGSELNTMASPCIIPFDNGYKMNIRLVNYKIQPDGHTKETSFLPLIN